MTYVEKTNRAKGINYGGLRSVGNVLYIVIHGTGNDGDTDEGNGKYFAREELYVSAHDFVDSDSITHSVPYTYVAYAVGGDRQSKKGGKFFGKATNFNTVSVELCDDVKNGKVYPSQKTIDNAIAHTKKLMKKFNVPAERVIRHFDVNGKSCPSYWTDDSKWEKEFHSKLTEKKSVVKKVVEKVTKKKTTKYYAKYKGDKNTSLDNILKAIGVPSQYRGSYEKRKALAKAQGISGYVGSVKQNTKLKDLARKGKLKKV